MSQFKEDYLKNLGFKPSVKLAHTKMGPEYREVPGSWTLTSWKDDNDGHPEVREVLWGPEQKQILEGKIGALRFQLHTLAELKSFVEQLVPMYCTIQ